MIVSLSKGVASYTEKFTDPQEREDLEVKIGQFFAFIIAITAIITGATLVMHGYEYSGSFISTLGLGTIVTAFLNTRKKLISESKKPNSKTHSKKM